MNNRFDRDRPQAANAAPQYSRFVADIGGTHARFALVEHSATSAHSPLVDIKVFKCADFDGPAETVIAYQEYLGHSLPARACIAAAGPVSDGEVRFTNLNWRLSAQELRKMLDIKQLEIVNDFTAVAHAVSEISSDQLKILHAGNPISSERKVVLGAGTGLGVAAVATVEGKAIVIDSEGGHSRFAPACKKERELLSVLSLRHEFVSMEMLLSGPGIRLIHKAVCQIYGYEHSLMGAEEITSCARNLTRESCVQTMQLYRQILASFCADMALTFGARGGVFLVGDILRSIEPILADAEFSRRYSAAGSMSEMVCQIPVSMVQVEDPGLYGAAFCAID